MGLIHTTQHTLPITLRSLTTPHHAITTIANMHNALSKRSLEPEETGSASERVDVKLLTSHIHLLSGEIERQNIDECIKWVLMENLDQSTVKPLTLYINSVGGDLYGAFALIDIMKQSQHPIRTIGIGAVMSAAFLIFASGTKGERYASRNASFMSHQYAEQLEGKHHDLKASMKECESYNDKMIKCLQDATNLPYTKIKSKLLPPTDVYLTPTELVKLGIADYVL